ncbi:MAG: 2-dehydropantoate 2-reductase [Bacillota bacterium]|nr:2-dehydropantoate 2-reductase [Bacillota bacterium]
MIKSVICIGHGALGLLFGQIWQAAAERRRAAGEGWSFAFLATDERQRRFREGRPAINGREVDFAFIKPEEVRPVDLVIFTVKSGALAQAIRDARGAVGSGTILLSLLNGVSSEDHLRQAFPEALVLTATAQGMDATREGYRLSYSNLGTITYGLRRRELEDTELQAALAEFEAWFRATETPGARLTDMERQYWGKFMLNCGVNQAAACFNGPYGCVQKPGPARELMRAAMEEACAVANAEGVALDAADIDRWIGLIDTLDPDGSPSMRQDLVAGRPLELELFAGTVLKIAAKHGLDVPTNRRIARQLGGSAT